MKRDEMLKRVTDTINSVNRDSNSKAAQYFKVADADLEKVEDKGNVATLLDNFQRIQDADEAADFIKTSNYGPYVMEFWPIVTAWYPEFPLKDLVSVQSMDRPLAYLFFSKLLTGTNKAGTVAGETVETATGPRSIKGRYPTGEIFGESILAADFVYDNTEKESVTALAYYPLNVYGENIEKFQLAVVSTDARLSGTLVVLNTVGDIINFKLTGDDNNNIVATMDITTGQLVIIEDAAATEISLTSVTVNYVWSLENADETNIPTIVEDVEKVSMEAIPRALGIKWSIFSEYVKDKQFGKDIRTDTTKRVLELLYQYQCRYVLDMMYDYATGNSGSAVNVSLVPSTGVTVETRVQEVLQALSVVSNTIEVNNGRMMGNKIVTGRTFKSWLESLPKTHYQPIESDQGYNSPRKIGVFGPYDVFYDPQRDAGEAFMTYKGKDWYDAAFYIGEFMPIIPTDAIALGTTVRSSMCSMEAYKFHKKDSVVKLAFATE